MSPYTVSEQELDEFEAAIWVACQECSPIRLNRKRLEPATPVGVPSYYRDGTRALVLSFDAGWYPFLCNSKGYNRDDQRWYVPKASRLIAMVAMALQAPKNRVLHRKDGRTFLYADGARRRVDADTEHRVLDWTLPRASEVLLLRHDSVRVVL